MQALTKLADQQKQFKLQIIALSCVPVSVPEELGGLGIMERYTCPACTTCTQRTLAIGYFTEPYLSCYRGVRLRSAINTALHFSYNLCYLIGSHPHPYNVCNHY